MPTANKAHRTPSTATPGHHADHTVDRTAEGATRSAITRVALQDGDRRFTGIPTPEAFFANNRHLHALCDTIAQRFRKLAPWVVYEDAYQEAALEVVNSRRKFNADHGTPFGGYAWKNAIFKLTEMMQKASVPVSFDRSPSEPGEGGGKIVDRVLRGVTTVSFDAPVYDDATGGTVLDNTSIDDTALAPDHAGQARRSTIIAAFDAAASDLSPTVLDLVLAYLDGQHIPPADYPPGWGLDRLARAADRFSAILKRVMGEADARTRAGHEVTPAELRVAAAFTPATAPVTINSPPEAIAALGHGVHDPAQFDPWGGAFLAAPITATFGPKRGAGRSTSTPAGTAPACAHLPTREGTGGTREQPQRRTAPRRREPA